MRRFLTRIVFTRRTLWTAVALVGTATVAGFLAVWIGLAPVSASAGHWAVTEWFLHFAMRQAVQTRALGINAPPLDERALVLRGAGHYASGCAPCHGAPGEERSVVARQMTPEPPFLPRHVADWEPEELFWIVKHGIKFTGMPAWPALRREDEIWSMVAFLTRLPDLTPAAYRRLSGGAVGAGQGPRLRSLDDAVGAIIAESCGRCHGVTGLGRGVGAFPKLAGQNAAYLLASLRAYAAGERHSGIMQPVAEDLDADAMRRLAAHYAQAPLGLAVAAEPAGDTAVLGAEIARRGVPERGVPPCAQCHGPKDAPRAAIYPKLMGQYPDYLRLQLEAFRQGNRGGTPFAHIMRTIAERLSPEEVDAVVAYYGAGTGQQTAEEGTDGDATDGGASDGEAEGSP